jgi:hypothetical protein
MKLVGRAMERPGEDEGEGGLVVWVGCVLDGHSAVRLAGEHVMYLYGVGVGVGAGWLAPLGAKALVFGRLVYTRLLSVHQYVAHVCGTILLYRGHMYRLASQTRASATRHFNE